MSSSTLRSTFEGVRLDGDGQFVCPCGFPTKPYRVKRDGSPYQGLQYYACARYSTDPIRCPTWIWFNEKDRVSEAIPPEMRSSRTPRKQVDIRKYGQYTPPTTLKRKADTQSFDSGVGDMVNHRGPEPPSPSLSAKRTRSADAATQTADITARPDVIPMPRRRLFDEFLDPPRNSANASTDPAVVREPRPQGSLFGSPIRERTQYQPPIEPVTPPTRNSENSPRVPPAPRPRALPRYQRVHFTPSTRGNRVPDTHIAPLNVDSDTESYGWNDEMAGDIVDLAMSVENPRSSPLVA
ncbi:hypothetical protein BJX63DRAFT_137363 [Aspergillus granulosus]|uniref:Zinc finger GRF-type domain-containing protein n=1 Tax=Aspergillus granulosus TaxID=176169 RepID=A0ABR4HP71_9EURO